jgi:hypothetical protein
MVGVQGGGQEIASVSTHQIAQKGERTWDVEAALG